MKSEEIIKQFLDEMTKLDYHIITINIYTRWLTHLFQFYNNIHPEEIELDQIKDFIDYLIYRKHLSPTTVDQALDSIKFFFNSFLSKNYDFKSISIPKIIEGTPEILTREEIKMIINAFENEKLKVIISLIYACGLEGNEALNLKLSDIDLERNQIKIRPLKRTPSRRRKERIAFLSRRISDEIKNYIEKYSPKEYLFENRPGKQYSLRYIQMALKEALSKANINKKYTLTNLRHTYIKHLEQQGYHLANILENMKSYNRDTMFRYSKIGFNTIQIYDSPYDYLEMPEEYGEVDTAKLEKLLQKISNEDERAYLKEGIICIKSHIPKAGVIFLWNSAIRIIQNICIRYNYKEVQNCLSKHFGNKTPEIRRIEDFSRLKDIYLIQLFNDLGEIDKSQKKYLENCLDLRNACSHPSEYTPGYHRISAFVEDLIQIVFMKVQ